MKTRNCDQCGTEYQYKLGSSKYCSGTCRAKASVLNGAQVTKPVIEPEEKTVSPAPVRSSLEFSSAISDQARFIIRQLEKENDRWEAAYKEQKEKKEKAKNSLEKLQKEHAELKNEIALNEATAPTGLQGIMESDGFKEAMPYIGPVLQRLGERILLGGGNNTPSVEGSNETTSPIAQISDWYNSLSEATKGQILAFMQFLSKQDETSVARIMAQISASGMMGYSRAM